MITRMNYLLLITVMIAAIDSSYGRCCPCEKKKGEKAKEDKSKLEKDKNELSNDNKEKVNVSDLMDNKIETKEIFNINYNDSNIPNKDFIENDINNNTNNSQPLHEKEINDKVKTIINEALKIETICDECIKNTTTENKIIVIYDIIYDQNNPENHKCMTKKVNFDFCSKHKNCHGDSSCKDASVCLTFCGHRLCEKHCQCPYITWYKCPDCNEYNCNYTNVENFGKHIWCKNTIPGVKNHYFCFGKNPSGSPYGKDNYDPGTWVCPEHLGKQKNNKK